MPMPVRSLPVVQNWDCHGCTDCCREYRVQVTDAEKARIDTQGWADDPAMKGVAPFVWDGGWFSGRYRLNHTSDGSCVFLNEQGGCRIHAKFGSAAKPLACRVFPFVFIPFGNQWRVGLRFVCPSAANDLGRPVSEHQAELREYAEALEVQEGIAGRAMAAPILQKGRSVPWNDLDLFIRAFRGHIADERRPLEWRLRKCLAVIQLCREARFDAISGDRLREFLEVIGGGVNEEVPARPEAVPPPSWIGRILFRQTMAIQARVDKGRYRGISRHGRSTLLWAAWKFAQGTGRVPAVHGLIPDVSFEQIENPVGPLPEASTKVLVRYFQLKLDSGQFFGPNNFQHQFWDGLVSLIQTYPAIMWLSRALHHLPREEALIMAMRIVDNNFGFNPMLGSRRQKICSSILNRRGEIARLIAWYSR
ncbi:MAG: YkgJ family cysteine cluster protein [Planctomycetes bacterium]|nr:YkgJ family cysteine cluster protein [Planctomycetota bacterium]